MPSTPIESPPARRPGLARRLHGALMPDYNTKATVYWWTMVLLGFAVLAGAVARLIAQPFGTQFQILFGCGVALLAGLFPVRVPGSKNSFAAGEVFIMLLLLLHGPAAAVLGAAAEAFVGSARTSKRWTSRLVSPTTAAVSMAVVGGLFQFVTTRLPVGGALGEALVLVLAMLFGIANFMLNTVLITLVIQFKRNERLGLQAYFSSFGWVGITYSASALIAGLLYLAFKTTGIGVMVGAVPIIILMLVMLHYHFRQRESDDKAQLLRVEAAEREAAQSARHLLELRNSEQRFHAAFSHAAIGMALVADDGEVLQANAAMYALLGTNEQRLLGQRFQTLVHAEDVAMLQQQWQALLDGEVSENATELRCRRPSGADVWVAMHSGHFAEQRREPRLA